MFYKLTYCKTDAIKMFPLRITGTTTAPASSSTTILFWANFVPTAKGLAALTDRKTNQKKSNLKKKKI